MSKLLVLGCGWAFPVERKSTSDDGPSPLAMSADDASVHDAIEIILSTRKGERVMRPEFGCDLGGLLFSPNDAATRATAAFETREALRIWEPRIELLDVRVSAGGDRGEMLLIEVDYRVRSTDNRYNLVYPFYLDRALV
ncbi:GPW/gp25 family protein [Variovorax sp. J22R115]|uniref:GPW/gp25 family protein n=1 Tax=Variovorax sp. J22R115 TaxID=3053509 RepID=UPI002577947D|nr:GPW/gp25 family protein [Variovorax sp. J22R115]MDM0047918.1 GPW/gp25 family protein [Variovorax sp. J22R115]